MKIRQHKFKALHRIWQPRYKHQKGQYKYCFKKCPVNRSNFSRWRHGRRNLRLGFLHEILQRWVLRPDTVRLTLLHQPRVPDLSYYYANDINTDFYQNTMQIILECEIPPAQMYSSTARHEKQGYLLLTQYFSNRVNWISPQLLRLFLTTRLHYFRFW